MCYAFIFFNLVIDINVKCLFHDLVVKPEKNIFKKLYG